MRHIRASCLPFCVINFYPHLVAHNLEIRNEQGMIEVQSYFEHLVFFGPVEDSYLEQGTLVGYLVILD